LSKSSQSPTHLILASRSQDKIQACIAALKAEHPNVDYRGLKLDLSSQKAVRAAAAELLSWDDIPTVDIVINSAGVMGVQQRTLTEDGIEMHFATNHIGHWLFSCLIMPKLIKASESNPKGATRIVNVSSGSPMFSTSRFSDINFDKKNKDLPQEEQPMYQLFEHWGYKDTENQAYVPLDGYNRSKVANVLFGIGATKRLYEKHGILATAVHPGVIPTDLGRSFPPETLEAISKMVENNVFKYKTLGAGASTTLVAALDPKLKVEDKDGVENYGAFLNDCQIETKALPLAVSTKEADKLWDISQKLVKQEFAW
jgi:NAD(P)-dependent dehydrogenase (short-subunit alcohol dehydrogenase family)